MLVFSGFSTPKVHIFFNIQPSSVLRFVKRNKLHKYTQIPPPMVIGLHISLNLFKASYIRVQFSIEGGSHRKSQALYYMSLGLLNIRPEP